MAQPACLSQQLEGGRQLTQLQPVAAQALVEGEQLARLPCPFQRGHYARHQRRRLAAVAGDLQRTHEAQRGLEARGLQRHRSAIALNRRVHVTLHAQAVRQLQPGAVVGGIALRTRPKLTDGFGMQALPHQRPRPAEIGLGEGGVGARHLTVSGRCGLKPIITVERVRLVVELRPVRRHDIKPAMVRSPRAGSSGGSHR